jgi:hypothetical protein
MHESVADRGPRRPPRLGSQAPVPAVARRERVDVLAISSMRLYVIPGTEVGARSRGIVGLLLSSSTLWGARH